MFDVPGKMTACVIASLVMLAGMRVDAQSGANVLLVVNDASATGETIAKRYAGRRGVPGGNICHISTTLEETIDRQDYGLQIESPIWRCIASQRDQDRILCSASKRLSPALSAI